MLIMNENEETKVYDLRGMYLPELEEFVISQGWQKFRARQIFEWLHKKHVRTAEEMKNLPMDIRKKLEECIIGVEEELRLTSKADGTIKFLFRLYDGQMIETVFMRYKHGNSICISSQAGCRMGCDFCASAIGGLVRNLTASEMLDQIYAAMYLTGERISNIVVMGTGEALDNYDNLIRFLNLITDENGYGISERSITVSSCGLVPAIRKFADEERTVTLALSLHAVTDEKRRRLMPIAKSYTIEETLDACRYYFEKTGRRITFEFCLVKGVNDSPEDAKALAKLIKDINSHVNLIPVNPVAERSYRPGQDKDIYNFKNLLEKNQINVTIRRSMGRDIDAACGQLRRKYNV